MRPAVLLVLLSACGGKTPALAQPGASTSSTAPERSGPVKVGDHMAPITGPLPIPVKGAKLTMVNYFARWCQSGQRWMPLVEEMRKKHAAAGLAVVGVGNYDEGSQADLEAFVKQSGASFPVSADQDHRILQALTPNGWGQAIIVVDAQGMVRLVHRGTYERAFDEVDAEVGRLLAE